VRLLAVLLCLAMCGCSESVLYRADADAFDAWVESMRMTNETETVHAIGAWMRANMKYEDDGLFDYFKPWERAWNQTGDCEDFAGVACEALHRLGYTDYRLVSVWSASGRGHTVCSNGLWHVGNWPVAWVGEHNNFRAVAFAVYPDWTRVVVRSLKLEIEQDITR
jgi:hypothetical protein